MGSSVVGSSVPRENQQAYETRQGGLPGCRPSAGTSVGSQLRVQLSSGCRDTDAQGVRWGGGAGGCGEDGFQRAALVQEPSEGAPLGKEVKTNRAEGPVWCVSSKGSSVSVPVPDGAPGPGWGELCGGTWGGCSPPPSPPRGVRKARASLPPVTSASSPPARVAG